jgi:hypothetical protein
VCVLQVVRRKAYLILPDNKKNDPFICDEFVGVSVRLSLGMSISWENAFVNETQEFSANPVINKKVKKAVSGLQKTIQKYFIRDIINEKDKELAADFLISCVKQDGVKLNTRRVYVIALAFLCRYLADKQNNVSLDQVTADILYDYIDSFRPASSEKEEAVASTRTTITEAEEGGVDEEEARLLQQLNYQSCPFYNNRSVVTEDLG